MALVACPASCHENVAIRSFAQLLPSTSLGHMKTSVSVCLIYSRPAGLMLAFEVSL